MNGNITIDIPAGNRTGAKETYVLLPESEAPESAAPESEAPESEAPGTAAAGTAMASTEARTVHTIKEGDTLNQICRQYGCRLEDLLALNPGVEIDNLQVGSDLIVP